MKRLLLVLVVLSGCAAPRATLTERSPDPRSLSEVNEDLLGAVAQIEFTDGTTVSRASEVEVLEAETAYTVDLLDGPTRRAVPTAEVERIVVVRGRSSGTDGAIIEAVPGLLLAIGSAYASPDSDSSPLLRLEQSAILGVGVVAGITFAVIGGLVGSSLDRRQSPGRSVIVYQGPVDAYLAAPPRDLAPADL